MKKTWIFLTLFFILIASYLPLFLLNRQNVAALVREDGIIENCSAIFYFMASCLMIYLFLRSKPNDERFLFKTKRNFFFLLLGIFLIFCLGEEISWGQRILNIKTPEVLQDLNRQNEINIHNLKFFHGTNVNDEPRKGIELLFASPVLYSLAWVIYCVLLPVLNILSKKIKMFCIKISLPVVPAWIGSLFLINYLIAKTIQKTELFTVYGIRDQALTEIKENNYAFLYLVICIAFVILTRYINQPGKTVQTI